MSIQQIHPKYFFKYTTASTAEIALKNRTLRWSHPSKFDDTFDVARVCEEKMDKNKQKQIFDALLDLATNHRIISEVKKTHSIDISSVIDGINEKWKEIREDSRILCLGIEKDNRRLWNDYAEKHRGVVIELICRKESDSPWLVAKPVEYVDKKDLFITAREWAEIISIGSIKGAELLIEKCCTKKIRDNEHKWSEQNEWRIPSYRGNHETGLVSDYGVNPNDISAVYFGHKMESKTQDKLLSFLDGELEHVSEFRCMVDSKQNISFIEIR